MSPRGAGKLAAMSLLRCHSTQSRAAPAPTSLAIFFCPSRGHPCARARLLARARALVLVRVEAIFMCLYRHKATPPTVASTSAAPGKSPPLFLLSATAVLECLRALCGSDVCVRTCVSSFARALVRSLRSTLTGSLRAEGSTGQHTLQRRREYSK